MALTQQPTTSSPIASMALGSMEISKEGINFETNSNFIFTCFTCFLICYNFADSVTVITRVKVDHIVPFNGCKPSHTSSLHNDTFALAMNKGEKIA